MSTEMKTTSANKKHETIIVFSHSQKTNNMLNGRRTNSVSAERNSIAAQ